MDKLFKTNKTIRINVFNKCSHYWNNKKKLCYYFKNKFNIFILDIH